MQRRTFIKSTCALCTGALFLGAVSASLQSCTTTASVKATVLQNIITVLPTDFLEGNALIVKTNSLPFYLLCVRDIEGHYHTVEMKCSHQDQPLNYTGNKLSCASHGSLFDLHGNVLQAPATQPLRTFKTLFQNNQIIIQL
jgi:nitrite reductase/ring-hydroxylating ferredoxin subunit